MTIGEKRIRVNLKYKLVFSYVAIILLVIAISLGFLFTFFKTYTVRQSREKLREDAKEISRVLTSGTWHKEPTMTDLLRFFRETADSSTSLLLADESFTYIESSGLNVDHLPYPPSELLKEIRIRNPEIRGAALVTKNKTLINAHVQEIVDGHSQETIGFVILFSEIQTSPLFRHSVDLYLFCMLLASVLGILIALILSQYLTRNLNRIRVRADEVANRQFESDLVIESGDEIEDLSVSIDRMAQSLSEYDNRQKVFLQNASHELRTPLMSIRGYTEGLRDGVFSDPEPIEDAILNQVSRLEKLVDDLIFLSKIENRDEELILRATNVTDLFEEAISRVDGIKGDVTILPQVTETLTATLDAEKTVTALTNLLTNALRFAKKEILLSAHEKGGRILISVADDGPGIDEEEAIHLFDRFFKGKKGKYGLGLSIVNAITVAQGGTATVRNRHAPETGAVFELSFPQNLPKNPKNE